MRRKLASRVAIFVGAVAVFGSGRTATGQDARVMADLTARMPDDATAVDVKAVVDVAIRLGVPVGFEEVGAVVERVSGPFRPHLRQKPIVSVRPTPLDVRGVTVRHALDAVVAKDRRYAWKLLDGVVVVRPVAAWHDPDHLLLRRVPAASIDIRDVSHVVDALQALLDGRGPSVVSRSEEAEASLNVAGGTLLEVLNAVARAHGGLHWSLTSSSTLVLLDRGRAVEAIEPALRIGGDSGEFDVRLAPAR